jgi:hypothetical protein
MSGRIDDLSYSVLELALQLVDRKDGITSCRPRRYRIESSVTVAPRSDDGGYRDGFRVSCNASDVERTHKLLGRPGTYYQ